MSNSAWQGITPRRGRRIQAGARVPVTGPYIRQSAEGATERNHSVALSGLPCGCILLQGLHPCLCSDTPSGLPPPHCHSDDRRNLTQQKKAPLHGEGFGVRLHPRQSERGDSNSRPLRPERSTLPTALLSDSCFRLQSYE